MYGVSDDIVEAYKADGVHKRFRVVIGNTSYDNEYIVDDTFNLKQSILDQESFEAIGCIASSLSIDLHAQLPTKSRGKRIKVFIQAADTTELQIFDGYIDKCTKTANGWKRHIEAYDFLYNMSGQSGQADDNEKKKYDVTEWYNAHQTVSIGMLLTELCEKFGLPLRPGNKSLVNGSIYTRCGKNKSASSLSALDLLKYIMQVNGCFGYITGDGYFSWKYLVMHTYDDVGWLYPSAYLYPSSTLYPGQDESQVQTKENATNFIGEYESLEYQDFKMLPINAVKIRNYEKDENAGTCGSGKNVYIIQGNPLIFDTDKEEKDRIAKHIFDILNSTWYVPFNANLPGLPYLECGDEVNFWDFIGDQGQASLQRFYILNRTLSGGQHLKDNWSAEGNEYLHEFVTGSGDDVRDELEENYDTSDQVDEKIENAAGLARIISISPSDIPQNPDAHTLYCIQGEVAFVEELPEYDEDDSESPDITTPDQPEDPEETENNETPSEQTGNEGE